jgi:hypothetical protein
MRTRLLTLAFAAALTAGCAQADEAFDKNFAESCVSSATQSNVPAEVAKKACDCTLTKINEKFSTSDKLTMSPEQAQPMMVACLNEAIKS